MNKKELWLRLCNYHFDHLVPASMWDQVLSRFGGTNASTKAFAHKLSVKLGWNDRFALKAVLEYKKFVYLGVVSDFVVTPSEIIDQVWHQHILFSKAYRSFCQEVIEYDFDHSPELIPLLNQTGTYNAQYLDTLDLYRKEFDIEPPAAIWGTPKFDENNVPANGYRSKKKEKVLESSDGGSYTYFDSTPLHQSFEAGESFSDFEGYGGGDFGGAGAGGDWGDSSSDSSGSDSGSSCSSCSSGCGGGD